MNEPYIKHLFICTNVRPGGGRVCGSSGGTAFCQLAKSALRTSLPIAEKHRYRVSSSGCMGRCANGPVAVSYPDGHWWQLRDEEHVKEIVNSLVPPAAGIETNN